MDIKQVKAEGLKRSFNVIFSKEDVEKKEAEQLASIAKKADIKGFRKGKAPIDIIEKNYKQSVLVKAFEGLTKECLTDIYKNHKVSPVTEPTVNIIKGDIMKKEEIEISLDFETFPEVPEIDLAAISLNKTKLEVKDEDITEFLTQLSKHYRSHEDVTEARASKAQDTVVIDFSGKINDELFEGGTAKDYPLELGSNTFIPGFEDQLLNKNIGEKIAVKVPFPADYQNKELAGKDAIFDVEIKKIQQAVDCKFEDLPAKIGIKDLDTLKNDIKERHLRQYEHIVRNELKNELIESLIKKVDFALPEILVQKEQEALAHNYEHYKKDKDLAISAGKEIRPNPSYDNKNEEQIISEHKEQANKRIKLSLIFNEIADVNSIYVLQEEVEQEIMQEAAKYKGQETTVVNYYKSNQQAINQLRNRILEDKILDFVFSQVKLNEKAMTLAEYNKSLEEAEQIKKA